MARTGRSPVARGNEYQKSLNLRLSYGIISASDFTSEMEGV